MSAAPDARDEFTARCWNGQAQITAHPPRRGLPPPADLARQMYGRDLQPTEWAGLSGAPDGAAIDITTEQTQYGAAIALRVTHPWYDGAALRLLYIDDKGRRVIRNDHLALRDAAPDGTGTRILAHQVRAARALEVSYLSAEAAGGPGSPYVGYYVWPRLGYTGPLPEVTRRRLPQAYGDAMDVLDLVSRPGGAEWWRRNGRSFEAVFDLRDGSPSLAKLAAYTSTKGIRI